MSEMDTERDILKNKYGQVLAAQQMVKNRHKKLESDITNIKMAIMA